ncbi:ABC-2 type transport system ATP-binding protein [Breznakia sp. PF5-3]|uniref:ABC transporter ATP-binding protein n=1 Tax=unclassified Breznakia TaxID=2623764 RepID=UPI0024077501|nr:MULTISPECIES: ABC transporter ATP-binding protein [unclassified Breznakia]MDF9825673.1 ABC-2 type transport system ATP-binding protein [Breznakia sp. PM6-1]MDF9836516.1 ABC-2 type transport system ATP-binding protein [Breznakia sp. PF5-3]MDF9838590.1 ABC-2 type transport system ATP-binding protein [Breznakia sp. PFB2-8]MDF9860597.1 ABC-2 type transport system ATP-binding protein [Breznakia sp. PH5-24]
MIKIENLIVKYKNLIALDVRDLQFEEGVAYGVVGENGAGKTTLFKSISNIITNYEGNIYMDDKLVKKNNSVLKNVGLVLDGMSVYKDRSGWFNIRYFGKLRECLDESYAKELAQDLDIYAVLDRPVKTYSYGMQKKLILLIAILNKPKYLILDEPFRGLDFETVKWFKNYLLKLKDEGTTLLISSHVRNDLESLCQKVHILSHGKIIDFLDLEEESKTLIRLIDTTNNVRFIEIMKACEFNFEVRDSKIRASIEQASWAKVQEQASVENITIIEMSKTSSLDGRMN